MSAGIPTPSDIWLTDLPGRRPVHKRYKLRAGEVNARAAIKTAVRFSRTDTPFRARLFQLRVDDEGPFWSLVEVFGVWDE